MFYELKNNANFWRRLTNFWAIIVFTAMLYDFATANAAAGFLKPLLTIYVAVLAFYAGDKEFDRWYHDHRSKHPGEIFVIAWTILIIILITADFIYSLPYEMPDEIVSAYIAVLGILAITSRSKSYYKKKKKK